MRFRLALVLLSLSATAVFAQGVTIGSLQYQSGGTIPAAGFVFVDTSHPATADGTITNAALRWLSDNACSGAFKLRVFRPSTDGSSLTMVGETPPLDVVAGNGVLLVSFPGIAVQKGDLLAVAQLGPGSCGGTTFSNSPNAGDTVYELGNFTGGPVGGTMLRRMRLDAVASNGAQHLAGVVPVVGAVQGVGAFFRTSLQLTNGSGLPIDGTLTYHPAGKSGANSDPSMTYHLGPHTSLSYADIAGAMGQSGIGTLDVYSSSLTPDVTARVFNDVGAAGTYGLTEDLVTPSAMVNSDVEFVTVPIAADLTNFRVNIGVRTLDTPTAIGLNLYDSTGKLLATTASSKTYPPNYFEQVTLAQFIANFTTVAPPAGGSMFLYVDSGGPVVLYTSTVDNRTKDSDLKMIVAK